MSSFQPNWKKPLGAIKDLLKTPRPHFGRGNSNLNSKNFQKSPEFDFFSRNLTIIAEIARKLVFSYY